MKKLITVFVFTVFITSVSAQTKDEKPLSEKFVFFDFTYEITNITVDGKQLNEKLLPKTLILKNEKQGRATMQLISKSQGTSSSGFLTNIYFKYQPLGEHPTVQPEVLSYKFNWHYQNNYDKKTGVAKVEYVRVYDTFKAHVVVTMKTEEGNITVMYYEEANEWQPLTPKATYSRPASVVNQ